MAESRLCSIPECGKPAYRKGRGFCLSHYQRQKRHGNPLAGRTPDGDPLKFYNTIILNHTGDNCLIWPYCRGKDGYGRMVVNGKDFRVSRYICEQLYGPAPTPKHVAAHSCGKGHLACVAKSHLRWATPADNKHDELVHGTRIHGEKHYKAKLTQRQADEIRSLRGKQTQTEIAALYGISPATVSNIQQEKYWTG